LKKQTKIIDSKGNFSAIKTKSFHHPPVRGGNWKLFRLETFFGVPQKLILKTGGKYEDYKTANS
jgi:hypothetical protein